VLQQDVLGLPSMIIDDREAMQTVLPLYGHPMSELINLKVILFILAVSISLSPFFLSRYQVDVTGV
jgi:hypothetical protein